MLVWLGWHRAVFVPAAAVAGCYLAGLYGRPEVDRICVVEALVVLAVVEATSWLDDASMGLPLSWSASLRRLGLELGIGLPVSLFVALMPTAGPRGLAALVIASVAILGVVFVVRVAAPERHG